MKKENIILDFSDLEKSIDYFTKKDRLKNLVEKEVKNDFLISNSIKQLQRIIQQYYNIPDDEILQFEADIQWHIIEFVLSKLIER